MRIDLDEIARTLEGFRTALRERDLEQVYRPVFDLCENIDHALARVRSFVNAAPAEGASDAGKRDARIFLFFAEKKLDELKITAGEIDNVYLK